MPDNLIRIELKGLERLRAALLRFPEQVRLYMRSAGQEAAREVLDTEGLRLYPPATNANQPPTPYYIRGIGMQRAGRAKPEYNDYSSERYGTQFYNVTPEPLKTYIGNRASYAPYLGGDEQAKAMAAIGWRKLIDVARDKIGIIQAIYQAWVDKMLKDMSL